MDKKRLHTLVLAAALSLAPVAALAERDEDRPTAFVMMGDLLVARPAGTVLLAVGTVTFVATLPFSFLGGNMFEASNVLVVQPAREVLFRCLGCTRSGWHGRVRR
jgi:hypothetical protein